jgi:hypothetical protein
MKAIYLNLDPYLQAVADWLNAGKPGTAPSFDPLPVAVTIPLGESACIYIPGSYAAGTPTSITIDGTTVKYCGLGYDLGPSDGAIANDVQPHLSTLDKNGKYTVVPVTSSSYDFLWSVYDGDDTAILEDAKLLTVLVRRETASGPVDLVDFTPSAAGG